MTGRTVRLMLVLAVCLGASAHAAVTLTDNGTTVTLANGLVSAIIQKSNGTVTDFRIGASPDLTAADGYYYTTHVTSGTNDFWVSIGTGGSTYSVTTNTSEMVDISIRNTTLGVTAEFPNGLFDVDMHYVMRDGVAGLYQYYVWQHHANQPEAGLYQQRLMVAKTSLADMGTTWTYCGGDVWDTAPGSALSSGTIIYDSTYELPATNSYTWPTGEYYEGNTNWPVYYTLNPNAMVGMNYNLNPVWTKYDWSVYPGTETASLNAFGVCTENYGVWVLAGSIEYLNGGPTKLRGTVQDAMLGLNANEGHGQADNGPDQSLAAGEAWEKIYGPYMIYANSGTDHEDLWADAQTQGAAEVSAWPHSWLVQSESLYPRSRGAISGQLTAPGQSTANAQIIVCDNASIDWIWQGAMNYIYWTQADADGNFTVPKLNPGTYSVFAYAPGVAGDFQTNGIVVSAGATNDVGELTWNPPIREQILFRVGTPDRSTEEFRYGDLPKQFGLWFRYLDEVGTSTGAVFNVGTSDPKTDWYYAQPVVPVHETETNGTFATPAAYINFNLDSVPTGDCTLTMGLAGSCGSGAFYVYVNDDKSFMPNDYTGQYTLDDNALDRDATTRGQQQVYSYTFDSSLLHTGTNTVKITVRKTGDGTWVETWRGSVPPYGIMYDYVQLEAGALTSTPQPTVPTRLTAAAVSASQVDLSWDASVAAQSYTVKRSAGSGGPYTDVATNITATSYNDGELTTGETYYYVVSAVNEFGESADSVEASVTVTDTVPPAAPTGLFATASDGSVSLSWTTSSEPDMGSYTVYRSTTSGTNYSAISTNVTTTNCTDSAVVSGTTYYYVVTATDTNSNESAYSAEVSGTPHAGIYYELDFEAGDVSASTAELTGSGTPVDIDGTGTAYTTVYECGDYFAGAFVSSGTDVPGGSAEGNGMGALQCRTTGGNTIMFFNLGSPLVTGNGAVQVDFTVGLHGLPGGDTDRPLDNGNIVVGLYDGLSDVTEYSTSPSFWSINDTPVTDTQTITISNSAYYDTPYIVAGTTNGWIHHESLVFTVDSNTSSNLFLAITGNDASGDVSFGLIDNIVVAQINPGPPTSINAAISGGVMTLSWPENYTGWHLESTTNLMDTNAWIAVPDSESTNVFDIGTTSNNTLFLRLVYP